MRGGSISFSEDGSVGDDRENVINPPKPSCDDSICCMMESVVFSSVANASVGALTVCFEKRMSQFSVREKL